MMFLSRIAIAFAVLGADNGLESLGRLEDPALREVSGIVKSRRHPGIYWVHNDSGNPPALYAIRRDGSLVRTFTVKVPNIDWEDIATDDEGHLYIGEIGNNFGLLPRRAIHQLDEPDPSKPPSGPLPVTLSTYYRFPPGAAFDAESLFVQEGRAFLIEKSSGDGDARIVSIPLHPPAPFLRPALPEAAGRLPGFTEPATGADLSPDGHWLAVCSINVTRTYYRSARDGDAWRLIGTVPYPTEQFEAICWDGPDLILVSEGRTIGRIAEASWRPQPGLATMKADGGQAESAGGSRRVLLGELPFPVAPRKG